MDASGTKVKDRLGGIVGAVVGGLLALAVIWHKINTPSETLSTIIIVGLPWGGGMLGNYLQRRYF